jgi:GTP-binding protein
MIRSASYIGSFQQEKDCPKEELPEFAFIGRSNVGKSSLINLITNRKELAKVSQTPGKTQSLNFFKIDESWFLVDLPGYGYAKLSKTARAGFEKMIKTYLESRERLYCVFVLIDGSIPPQKIDLEFMAWMGKKEVPAAIVFTKTDKERQNIVSKNIADFKKQLKLQWKNLPPVFYTSASKRMGGEAVLDFVKQCMAGEDRAPDSEV